MSLTIKVADIGYKQDNSNNFETFNGFFGGATPSAADIISENELSTNTTWSSLKIKTELDKKKPFLLVDSLPEEGEPDTVYIIKDDDKTKSYIYSGEWIPFYSGVNNIMKLIVTTDAGATVYATNGNVTYSAVAENGVAELALGESGIYTVYAEKDGKRSLEQTVEVTFNVEAMFISPTLNDNTWAQISAASTSGKASSLWNVGDYKEITLSGTCLNQSLSGTYRVFILGFDHNKYLETDGQSSIHFGCFKTTAGQDIAIGNSNTYPYETSNYYGLSTTAHMNMCGNNTTNGDSTNGTNYLGWKNTFMRHTILGSTNKSWDSEKNSTSADFNAPADSATAPAANTLMSCLPADLRDVIRPVKKWTDNVGQATDTASNVTQIVDYLPLLAEYEVQGVRSYANSSENTKQAQYAYYVAGNTKIKQLQNISSATRWWLRSPRYDGSHYFCRVHTDESAAHGTANRSFGVAPLFVV